MITPGPHTDLATWYYAHLSWRIAVGTFY